MPKNRRVIPKEIPLNDEPLSPSTKEYQVMAAKFINSFREVSKQAYDNSSDKGFWDQGSKRNKSEMIALMHSELSEALEALRVPDAPDKHCPQFTNLEVELADVIIRVMDFSHGWGLDVASAVDAKMRANQARRRHHGKKF